MSRSRWIAALALLAGLSCGHEPSYSPAAPVDPAGRISFDPRLVRAKSGLPVPDDPDLAPRLTANSGIPGITPFRLPEHARVYKRCAAGVVVVLSQQFRGDTLVGSSLGTGFVISKTGFVVTNRHVIEGADVVVVLLKDPSGTIDVLSAAYQERFGRVALVVGTGASEDLALLKILDPPENLTVLPLAEASEIEPALDVLAIGHPRDYDLASNDSPASFWDIAPGMVRNVQKKGGYSMLVRHTTPINKGNSGGPLLNLEGKVLGVNTMKPPPESEQDGVFWSIGVTDVAAFLKRYESLMQKDFGMLPGGRSLDARTRVETVNLGFVGAGQKAQLRFKLRGSEARGSVVFGYETSFAMLVRSGKEWLLCTRSGDGWTSGEPRKLALGDWHELTYSRDKQGLTVELDGKPVPSGGGAIPPRGWSYVFFRGVQTDIERP